MTQPKGHLVLFRIKKYTLRFAVKVIGNIAVMMPVVKNAIF